MINRSNARALEPGFVPKFSDPDILKAVLRSGIWRQIFLRDKKAFWTAFKALVFLKLEMFVSPLKMVLRYNHGTRTTGVFITLMSAVMMIAFNTPHAAGYMVTVFPLTIPVMPFLLTGEQLYYLVFVDIRSVYLLVFWMSYCVLAAIHLLVMFTRSNDMHVPPTKRGYSIFHTVLFRHVRISELIVQRFLEPIFIGLAGYVLYTMQVDFTFGMFLILAATCLFIQELYDAVMKFTARL